MYNNDEALNKKTLTILAKLRGNEPCFSTTQVHHLYSIQQWLNMLTRMVILSAKLLTEYLMKVMITMVVRGTVYGRTLTLDSSSQVQINLVLSLQLVF